MDYEKLSDFEINGLIAMRTQKVGDFTQARGLNFIHEYRNPVEGYGAICLGWKEFDPCNNPADAWPVIVENEIDIIQNNGQDCALATNSAVMMMGGDDVFISQDINPLRAAMIVFLMMQESKHG